MGLVFDFKNQLPVPLICLSESYFIVLSDRYPLNSC